jgi:hypothetical protein
MRVAQPFQKNLDIAQVVLDGAVFVREREKMRDVGWCHVFSYPGGVQGE